MGMFDYVDITITCPACGTLITGFQSKDGPCIMTTLPIERVDRLYSDCPGCERWFEFKRRYPDENDIIPGFDLDTSKTHHPVWTPESEEEK